MALRNLADKKAAGILFQRLEFAETVNRTRDTTLFRRVLYQLSYLGLATDLDSTLGPRSLFRQFALRIGNILFASHMPGPVRLKQTWWA